MQLTWERPPPLRFFNKLSLIAILGLLWGTSAFVNLAPFPYTTDSPCLFSNAEEFHFSLLDPIDGIPFTEVDGQLRKASRTLDSLPKFHVSRPPGEQSSFDVLLNSSYLGLFDTGRLGFVDRSSNGTNPVTDGNETFITSVFDISCNGTISLRLLDLLQYNLTYHAPTGGILGRPNGDQKVLERRASNALHNFVKRTEQSVNEDLPGAPWPSFSFLLGPLKVSDRDQIGFQPRCPTKPFGLEAFVKPGARPASFNGCGAENGMKIPDLRFTECCDNHDLCYDDCTKTWNQCNNDFRKCMHGQCRNEPTWTEWGCNNIADVFADFVGSRLGAWSFYNSNTDRCTCGCPRGTSNCTDMCLRDCRERCNFVDCEKEAMSISSNLAKATAKASKTSTATSKTTTTGASNTPLSTTASSMTTSKPNSTSSSPSSASSTTPSPGPPQPDCLESESSSWWPFVSWSTTPCAARNATFRAPNKKPENNGNSKSSWWPFNSWFTTSNSPPKNETVAVSSVARTETTIWWWPFFGDV